jgi:hypothetical protein
LDAPRTRPKPAPIGVPSSDISKPLVPSIRFEISKGTAFDEFHGVNAQTKFCFDFDVFGTRHRFTDITAQQSPTIAETITAPLPDRIETLCRYNHPIRVCVSTTQPETQFVGLGVIEWRKVLCEGAVEDRVDLIGIQNEVVGLLNYSLKLCGFEGTTINFGMFREVLDGQLRQEGLDGVETERQFAFDLKTWWRELTHLIDEKALIINANEIGTGKTCIFNFISPLSSRQLMTPGHCLRFCTLLTDLNAPVHSTILPNWAVIAARVAAERERLNILVSLLRGFGLNAYVVVARPRSFAVSLSSATIFFDVRSGKFGPKMPQVEAVRFIYNDEILFANLAPSNADVDWDIRNPLVWKELRAPKVIARPAPTVIECTAPRPSEDAIEAQVRAVIETHRQSVGLRTKWSTQLPKLLLPIADSYEHEKVTGTALGVHSFAAEAMRAGVRPFRAIRAAPACTNKANAGAIFKALARTRSGLDILGAKDDDAVFALVVRCKVYPGGVVAVWALLAIDSITPLHSAKSTK